MANVLETLVNSLPTWGTRLAYGEKEAVDGRELVPVTFVAFGFGGGEGSGEMPDPDAASIDGDHSAVQKGEGSGGGGGGYAVPLGAYAVGPDGVSFRPNPIALLTVSALLISAVGTAVVRVIRATS
jgi:uncharacterized spore protein YtfJ